jgi:homoserine kinase type II
MYEFRIEVDDLPFFLACSITSPPSGCPVPRTIHDRDGALFRMVGDKAVALIEFLPGVSVSHPTPAQARAVGRAGADASGRADFPGRAPTHEPARMATARGGCGHDGLASIDPAWPRWSTRELACWKPLAADLPRR